jgi:hypothetical protein
MRRVLMGSMLSTRSDFELTKKPSKCWAFLCVNIYKANQLVLVLAPKALLQLPTAMNRSVAS